MNELQIFNNAEFGQVRVVMIEDKPWFVGKDIAVALEYVKPENAIANHVDNEDKTTTLIQGTGSNYKSKAVIINESGVYSLVFGSKLPTAKKFKRWVTSEVLPSIRKTGSYCMEQNPMTQIEILQGAINLIAKQEKALAEHDNRIGVLEKNMADIKEIEGLKLDNWRLHIRPIINKIAANYPLLEGMDERKDIYQSVWHEIYDRLEAEMRCNLKIRLNNMKMRAKKKGATQNAISKLRRLDVIQEDPRLISGMKTVLREMMIKYC